MNPNNMIMILLLNMPFKNHLPVTSITISIVYVFNYLFTVLRIFPNKWQKMNLFRKMKIGHYCSTVSSKQYGFVSDMDKERGEQTSKTLSLQCERLRPHLLFYFVLYFSETRLKFQRYANSVKRCLQWNSRVYLFIYFFERPHFRRLSFERNRIGLMSNRKQCLCTCVLLFFAVPGVFDSWIIITLLGFISIKGFVMWNHTIEFRSVPHMYLQYNTRHKVLLLLSMNK